MDQIFSNTTLTVNQLIEKIDTGELGLPELQRPFIWKDSKVRDLFDSLMRGYPIGMHFGGAAAFVLAADPLCGHERPCLLDEHHVRAAGLCPGLGGADPV